MKLTDQPKDLVKAVQEVMKTTTPPAEKQKLSDNLASRYENMRPKQIDEKVDPEAERVARLKSADQRRRQLYKDIRNVQPGSPEHKDLKDKIDKVHAEMEANYPQGQQGFGLPVEPPKQPRRPIKTEQPKKQVATVTPTDMQGKPVIKPEPSNVQEPPPSWVGRPRYQKSLPTGTDADAAERNKQLTKPAEAPKTKEVKANKIEPQKTNTTEPKLAELPKIQQTKPAEAPKAKSVEVGDKIEIPKTDVAEPKLAELPKIEQPKKAEPEKAVPVAKVQTTQKMRHFNPYQGAETEGGHGFQSQIPYYDKPYEPGMQPAGYTSDVADRSKPQPAPEKEEDDVVTKGVKKAAGAVASLFKKKLKQEPDRDMKSPMSEATDKLHPMAVHVTPVGTTKYKVRAVGSKLAHGLKVGEHINDTEYDDLKDMGAKIKHIKEENEMDKTKLVVEKMMKKLDPVGKEDADVNNDGKTDKTDSYLANRRKAIAAAMKKEETEQQNDEQIDEASYSAKSARAGKDIGKPGKMFSKIAASAAKRYGSAEAGKRVAGSILKKLRAKK